MKLNILTAGSTLAIAALGLSAAALAQDSAPNTAVTGYVELEHLEGNSFGETFLNGDVDLSLGMPVGGFGVDLGLTALITEDEDYSALFGALTYSVGGHKFSVGVPRSAYDSLNNMPAIGGNRTLDVELGELNGGVTELLYLFDTIDAPYGLRYDGEMGNLTVAASAHWLDSNGEKAQGQALAFRYQLPRNFTILGDVERIDTDGSDFLTSRIGAEADYGQYKGGLSYFNRDFSSSSHIDGTETWFSYLPTDQITVTATALNTNVFDVYGLSLQYDWPVGDSMPGGAYAQIGAIDGRSLDTTYDLSIGFEF